MKLTMRNFAMLPIVLIFRVVPMSIAYILELLVFLLEEYNNFLDKHGIYIEGKHD